MSIILVQKETNSGAEIASNFKCCTIPFASVSISAEEATGTIDPSRLVGQKLSLLEKEHVIKLGPCQPSKSDLIATKVKCGADKYRYCSQKVFFHPENTKRQWVSYSQSKTALFCIPCLLFTDASLRGEHQRVKQGNAFTMNGYSNWKKQCSGIARHEGSSAHQNAVLAQAIFLQDQTIIECFAEQSKAEAARRIVEVDANRALLKRIVDAIIFLSHQGIPLRGHRESFTDDSANLGNFLEILKYLALYDVTMQKHLCDVKEAQLEQHGRRGRGSKLTFLSNDTQNKLVSIISHQISQNIVKAIEKCKAWALIVDTTPDVTHHEQISICVRIVHPNGCVSEHLLACQRAMGTTAEDLFTVIYTTLQSKDVSFKKLVAQTYDGASNMSGCYNGLQALIQQRINPNILYTHCYAHTLNLVLSDTASVAIDVVTLFVSMQCVGWGLRVVMCWGL